MVQHDSSMTVGVIKHVSKPDISGSYRTFHKQIGYTCRMKEKVYLKNTEAGQEQIIR